MTSLRTLALGLLLALAAPSVHAQVGGAAVVFLMIEPDSRAAGMGNANVAIADNANAVFWNPAGLAFQTGASAGITHSNWLPEFNANLFYEYAVGKLHVDGVGTLGAHITYFNLGEHEQIDDQGNNIGQFRSYDLAAGLSFGRQLTDNLGLGVSARTIVSNLATGVQLDANTEVERGLSFGLDLGLLYKSDAFDLGSGKASYALGANLANMGPTIGYTDGGDRDPIPTNIRLGYAFTYEFDEFNKITFANDFNKALYRVSRDTLFDDSGAPVMEDGRAVVERNVDPWYQAIFTSWDAIDVDLNPSNDVDDVQSLNAFEQMTIGAGAEYWYNNLFAMRAGYFYENPYNGNREFVTLGAGLRYNIFGVDFSYIYALEEDHPLSNTMRFSVLLEFQR